jgi:hypothetical protein
MKLLCQQIGVVALHVPRGAVTAFTIYPPIKAGKREWTGVWFKAAKFATDLEQIFIVRKCTHY